MTLMLSLESTFQANAAQSMLAALSQYGGMAMLLVLDSLFWTMGVGPKPLAKGWHMRLALPCALADLADTFFLCYGIGVLGAGLYIVLFGFVTVATAVLRRLALKRSQTWTQWAAIVGKRCQARTLLLTLPPFRPCLPVWAACVDSNHHWTLSCRGHQARSPWRQRDGAGRVAHRPRDGASVDVSEHHGHIGRARRCILRLGPVCVLRTGPERPWRPHGQ
jgi:hypothetical protein